MNIKDKIKELEKIQAQIDIVNGVKNTINATVKACADEKVEISTVEEITKVFQDFCDKYILHLEGKEENKVETNQVTSTPSTIISKSLKPSKKPDKIANSLEKFPPGSLNKLKSKKIELLIESMPVLATVKEILGNNLKVHTEFGEVLLIRPNQINRLLV